MQLGLALAYAIFVLALTPLSDTGVISTSTGDAAIRMFHTNIMLANVTMSKITSTCPAPSLSTTVRTTVPQQAPMGASPCVANQQPSAVAVPRVATNRGVSNAAVAPPPPTRRPVSAAQKKRGKDPPLACELYRDFPQNVMQYYQTEGDFSNVIFFLVKEGWLSEQDLHSVSMMHPDFKDMIESVPDLLEVDFSSLRDPVLDYASQTKIDPDRVRLMTACAVYYNLDIGLVVRYLGGEYTASWRNIPEILAAAEPYLSDEVYNHLHRVLTTGCPANFNWNEPASNKRRAIAIGNLPSVSQYEEIAQATVTKEVRNSHLLPLARWICTCSAHARHTPQNILVKQGKKPRLIWDGTTRQSWQDSTMNMMTPIDAELTVTFGTAFLMLCTWIWNLRISYPNEDILLAFVDISSCFRFPRMAADLAGAFGFIIGTCFFAANAGVFGSVISASSWEPHRIAIAAIAQACFICHHLISKYSDLLSLIRFDVPAPANTQFVQAQRCSRNNGVFDQHNNRLPTPHNIYVDDDLLAEIRPCMPQALASAFEAIFTVMGRPEPIRRPIAVAVDKLMELFVSYCQILLGLEINTRAMTVGISPQYRAEVLHILQSTWHSGRQSFTVKEMELLVGKLGRIAQAFRPLYYLMSHLYSSLAYALRANKAYLVKTSRQFRKLVDTSKRTLTDKGTDDWREITFAASRVARLFHGCKQTYRIPSSLAAEIDFIRSLMADSSFALCTPIGHIVSRDYTYSMFADSCKLSGGGWCTDLSFWWYLEYPPEIVRKAQLKNNKHGDYISINALEMMCVIINYAAAIHICHLDAVDISHAPTILNWCDNTSAVSWINTRCKDSLAGRALGRLFCGLLMGSTIGLCTDWISTTQNVIADDVSRVKRSAEDGKYDFSQLLTDHPSLRSCRLFQPSELLLSMFWEILLTKGSPDVLMLKELKPENLGSVTS